MIIKSPIIIADAVELWPSTSLGPSASAGTGNSAAPSNSLADSIKSIPYEVPADGDPLEDPAREEGTVLRSAPAQDINNRDDAFVLQPTARDRELRDELLKVKELKESAIKEGYAEGYAQAEQAIKSKYEDALNAFVKLTETGQSSIGESLKNIDSIVGSIVFEAVCKILGANASVENCKAILENVVQSIAYEDILKLRVSYQDLESLKNESTHLKSNTLFQQLLNEKKLEADPLMKLGGCKVVLTDGLIDASIETQLEILSHSIKHAVTKA